MLAIPQSVASRVVFWAFLASDHVTPATGKTIAITISKNGAALGNPSAGATNATAIGNGWYYFDLSTTDTNTLGPIAYRGAEATIDDVGGWFMVVSATTGGLSNLDAAISTRLASASYTAPDNATITSISAAVALLPSAAAIATAVWGAATRLLTAGTNIVLAKGTGVTGFNDVSTAQVNAEVVDALATDTYTEPGQGTPAATATLATKIGFLYKAFRNRKDQNATTFALYNDDATTIDQKATVSDDGTTFTVGEQATGP